MAGGNYQVKGELDYNLFHILPYLVVLVGALPAWNVFLVLVIGTVLAIISGGATGTIAPADIFTVIAKGPDGESGIMSMYDITVISIVVAGLSALSRLTAALTLSCTFIKKHRPQRQRRSIPASPH